MSRDVMGHCHLDSERGFGSSRALYRDWVDIAHRRIDPAAHIEEREWCGVTAPPFDELPERLADNGPKHLGPDLPDEDEHHHSRNRLGEDEQAKRDLEPAQGRDQG